MDEDFLFNKNAFKICGAVSYTHLDVYKRQAYYGACYGTGEMLLSGITTFADMYYFMDKVALACEKMGIRAVLGLSLIHI